MSNFINLNSAVRSMETDPSTAQDPIKRMFVCDGEFTSANIAILEGVENALHTQKQHDEVVLILEGEADFRVGEETQPVRPGDLIFIPHNTVHGPIPPGKDPLRGPSHRTARSNNGGMVQSCEAAAPPQRGAAQLSSEPLGFTVRCFRGQPTGSECDL